MESEPVELKPYEEAYKLKSEISQKIDDRNMWLMGGYVNIALLSALDKVLNGTKATIEYPKEPFGYDNHEQKIEEKELTQEEKDKYIDQLFGNLHLMQANFELNH